MDGGDETLGSDPSPDQDERMLKCPRYDANTSATRKEVLSPNTYENLRLLGTHPFTRSLLTHLHLLLYPELALPFPLLEQPSFEVTLPRRVGCAPLLHSTAPTRAAAAAAAAAAKISTIKQSKDDSNKQHPPSNNNQRGRRQQQQ